MYVFINDLSINPPEITIQNNWPLIDSVIAISVKLKEEYLLENVRVPNNFMGMSIANSYSINDLLEHEVLGTDERISLLDFLEHLTEEIDEEIKLELENAQTNKVFYAYLKGRSSDILTEAYIKDAPIISFATSPAFTVDSLHAELRILSESGNLRTNDFYLKNLYGLEGITSHIQFLVEWKKKIKFRNTIWDPSLKPIWNDSTSITLDNIKFPQSKVDPTIKEAELFQVGKIVAEMNGWVYDSKVTKLNKNSGQLRSIYRSANGKKRYYLSIDFEKINGAFELHRNDGKHLGEIDFRGSHGPLNPDPHGNNDHDIKVN